MSSGITRRETLRIFRDASLTLYLAGCSLPRGQGEAMQGVRAGSPDISDWLQQNSPINRLLPRIAPAVFSGDAPHRAHQLIRDRTAPLGDQVASSRRCSLAIVGGGLSGLTTAYLLRDKQPLLLEQAARFGGNSKGESWQGIDYSIGAAYFLKPESSLPYYPMLKELGVLELANTPHEAAPVELRGSLVEDWWSNGYPGETQEGRQQRTTLKSYFETTFAAETAPYPDIPMVGGEASELVLALDGESFLAHLERKVGGPLVPVIRTALEHYCWSSMGASMSEVSAAAAMNFYCAEFGELEVCPGGNAAVAERILEALASELPAENLRASSSVLKVSASGQGVELLWADEQGDLHTATADAAVLACPKFIVKRILSDIEPERLEAMESLSYRAYLVANVCLDEHCARQLYDMYLLGSGSSRDAAADSFRQQATDVIFANFGQSEKGQCVLTLYRPLPFEGGRGLILADERFAHYRQEFREQVSKQVLPLLGLSPENIKDIRIARWGHPLPVARQGFYRERVYEKLRAPHRGRVFFVQQDNWALPAFETALTEAFHFHEQIRAALVK
jgi:protoporphyrinogen oxidase